MSPRNDTRNARLLAAGDKLTNYVSPLVTAAVAALRERLSHLDGYPGSGEQGGKVHTSDTSTPTERIAAQRYTLRGLQEDLREAINDACNTVDKLAQLAQDVLRHSSPEEGEKPRIAVCVDGQHGKDGVIEWGDPLCHRSIAKAGLCSAHYQRWYRWRVDRGVSTAKDFAA